MSSFWHWYIIAITVGTLAGCWTVLWISRKMPEHDPEETTGHNFDGVEEYNKPLPLWWLWKFYALIAFAAIYLALYPGLGNWDGLLGWTSEGELAADQEAARKKYEPIFARYNAMGVHELIADDKAMGMGRRLYTNNCALCHGTDAKGAHGFPNLTDDDWLYGGDFETIKETLISGRRGQMPAWGQVLTSAELRGVVHHVLAISGNEHDGEAAATGAMVYQQRCAICHGANGKGSVANDNSFGAPNLTDNIWLYRQSGNRLIDDLTFTLTNGRTGEMPPWADILGENKIHVLSAYIYSLSKR